MKLEQATIKNIKVGDKCYIEVEIKKIGGNDLYPIDTGFCTFTDDGVRIANSKSNQLYHIRQEEIPTLGEGVEMEVSINGVNWYKRKIIAKYKEEYCDIYRGWWQYARPIELTLEQKLENALKENEELKKQLNEK